MLPAENVATFAVASALIIVVPGPSVLFVVGRSIALGRRAGVLSVVGNALGTIPAVLAVSFGVGALIAASVVAFTALKIVGGLYLGWLGIQAIRHRRDSADTARSGFTSNRLVREGVVVGLTNPKTIAFFVAVLPQFVAPSAGSPVWAQLLVLGIVFQVMALACDSVWALAAGTARTWFARSPRRMSNLTCAGGVLMVGLGGALVAGTKV